MKLSLPSRQTTWFFVRGTAVTSIGLFLGFYLVIIRPVPSAMRPLSMHFYRQYQEADITLPEISKQSSAKATLEYLELWREESRLRANVATAALAESYIYWSLVSCQIAFGLWFSMTWLGRKFERS
ncbi:hypothetical protein ACSYAD_30965 [Acaryochloris marina NIES-2412]|uniref:hypothetical protein n=1 Tax=Acaryochloris marina TaxID=155978 RepID=UPI004059A4E2